MNKIGWCSMTWNPVWGCRNHCEYCYARGIAKRFYRVRAMEEHNWQYWGSIKNKYKQTEEGDGALIINKALVKRKEDVLKEFIPTFLYSQFNKKFPKKPQRIFVGSMSEIYYWDEEWVGRVIEKVRQYPQHTFQFLTKFPEVYLKYKFPTNCWFGMTVTDNNSFSYPDYISFITSGRKNITFFSFEPLLSNHAMSECMKFVDWVIIGAETGNRKGKVVPKLDWVLGIVRYCEHYKIPVYVKDNLTKYYAECRGYKQFPKGVKE